MHSVDPMEIMLSDVFNKVFYEDESPRCKECDGWGTIKVDAPQPHNFDRDVGYMNAKMIECPECGGTGEKEVEDVS